MSMDLKEVEEWRLKMMLMLLLLLLLHAASFSTRGCAGADMHASVCCSINIIEQRMRTVWCVLRT